MIGMLLDAVILIGLLNVVNGDDTDFSSAFFVALGASIGTFLLTWGLGSALGFAGTLLGCAIAAGLLGIAVSAVFGVEIKRSILIGGLFMVIHIAISIGWELMFSTPTS